jgi:hypothetical protein
MAKVNAASSNGGTAPAEAVSSASALHNRIAPKPIAVAAREARSWEESGVMDRAAIGT